MNSKDPDELIDYWRRRALMAEFSRKHEEPPVLHAEMEMAALRTRLLEIENSRSWKITAPLRSLTERIINLRRKTSPQSSITPQVPLDEIESRILRLKQYTVAEEITDWERLLSKPGEGAN